jgi:hypothetical protein
MNRFKVLGATVLVFLLDFCFSATVRGGFITTLTAITAMEPDGLTLSSSTLTNDAASTLDAEGLGITVSADADLTNIAGPTGWDISYFTGGILVTWESSDPSTDISPGQSAVFTFESLLGPTQQPYLVTGLDSTGAVFDTNSGNIASPGAASVPEPGGLVLSGIGALGVLTILARRLAASELNPGETIPCRASRSAGNGGAVA